MRAKSKKQCGYIKAIDYRDCHLWIGNEVGGELNSLGVDSRYQQDNSGHLLV